ncbi:MAG: DUF4397 domain-containing protein [Fimbriimonas sp.]
MTFRARSGWLTLLILAVAGCGGGGGGRTSARTEDPEVRFVNASVDVPTLDFLVNDDTEAAAVPYGSANANGFRRLAPEVYDIFLRPTGAPEDAWAETFDAAEDGDYVLAGVGLREFGDDPMKRLRLAKVSVDRSVPNGNKSRLIVLNAFNRATGFENTPVDFKNPGENPQFEISDIPFGTTSTLLVDSGPQTFDVRLSNAEQVFVSESLDLQTGKVYFVLLTGIEGAEGPQAPDIKLIELETESN